MEDYYAEIEKFEKTISELTEYFDNPEGVRPDMVRHLRQGIGSELSLQRECLLSYKLTVGEERQNFYLVSIGNVRDDPRQWYIAYDKEGFDYLHENYFRLRQEIRSSAIGEDLGLDRIKREENNLAGPGEFTWFFEIFDIINWINLDHFPGEMIHPKIRMLDKSCFERVEWLETEKSIENWKVIGLPMCVDMVTGAAADPETETFWEY